MRQRNTTGHAWIFQEPADPAKRQVEVGEIADYPVLLHGWTPVDDEPTPTPAPESAKPARKPAAATATAKSEGGESA